MFKPLQVYILLFPPLLSFFLLESFIFHLCLLLPHLSCSVSPFSPLFSLSSMSKLLLAFSWASYSRHSWDSSWTRNRRLAELLLGCQSFRFSYCCLECVAYIIFPHQKCRIGYKSCISHRHLCAMPCSLLLSSRMRIESDRKRQLWPWEYKTFNRAVLMWGTQNPPTQGHVKPHRDHFRIWDGLIFSALVIQSQSDGIYSNVFPVWVWISGLQHIQNVPEKRHWYHK